MYHSWIIDLIAVFVFKTATYRYKVIVEKVECENTDNIPTKKRAESMAIRFAQLLERQVLSHPTQWFNFYDFFVE